MVTTHFYPLPYTKLSLFFCVHEIWFLMRPPPTFLDNVTKIPRNFFLKTSPRQPWFWREFNHRVCGKKSVQYKRNSRKSNPSFTRRASADVQNDFWKWSHHSRLKMFDCHLIKNFLLRCSELQSTRRCSGLQGVLLRSTKKLSGRLSCIWSGVSWNGKSITLIY